MCSSEMGGWREVDTEVLLGRGWRLTMKSRKFKIWASMCAVAYYFFFHYKKKKVNRQMSIRENQ